jgi:hypothetical protein
MNRIATTLVALGIAAIGSIAIAPAASAAPVQDGPSYVVDGPGMDRTNGNGPDAFIVTDNGRVPVFFCDSKEDKEKKVKEDKDAKVKEDKDAKIKHEKKCAPVGDETSGRF